MSFYKLTKKLLSNFFIRLFKIKVNGIENIPHDRAVLVCPNHLSNWDPFLVAAITDVEIGFMAKKQLFKVPLVRHVVKSLGAFPVNRGFADPTALKKAINLIKSGHSVGVFPQGTRCPGVHPGTTEIKSGAGLIAFRSACDVVPVSITTEKFKIVPFRCVYINIGKPISNSEFCFDSGKSEEYEKATQLIFSKILSLCEET